MSEPAPTIQEEKDELVKLRMEEARIASEARAVEHRIKMRQMADYISRLRSENYDETIGEDHYWIGFSEEDEDGGRQIDFYQWQENKGFYYATKDQAVDLVETIQRLYNIN